MVDRIRKVTKHEDYDINYKIQMAEIELYEEKLWERSTYCECGADSVDECSCDPEKQRRFRKRRKRKVNEKFAEELDRLMIGQLPKDGSQSRGESQQ